MSLKTRRQKSLNLTNFFAITDGVVDYIGNHELVEGIRKLKQSKDSIRISAGNILRLDVCSVKLYGRVELWWVIQIYNKISSPFEKLRNEKVLYGPNYDDFIELISLQSHKLKKGMISNQGD